MKNQVNHKCGWLQKTRFRYLQKYDLEPPRTLWAWLALYLGGRGFTVAILKIETWSKNEKVSLGQMLNFLFSDLVSIFNIATVNPWKQKGGGGLPPLGGVRQKGHKMKNQVYYKCGWLQKNRFRYLQKYDLEPPRTLWAWLALYLGGGVLGRNIEDRDMVQK